MSRTATFAGKLSRSTAAVVALGLIFSWGLVPARAPAATYTWISLAGGSSDWFTASNWTPNANYPGSLSSDEAYFAPSGGTLNTMVNLSARPLLGELFLASGGNGYTITASSAPTRSAA